MPKDFETRDLAEKDFNAYVNNEGAYCPYCPSTDLTRTTPIPQLSVTELRVIVRCTGCLKSWVEILTLSKIIEIA